MIGDSLQTSLQDVPSMLFFIIRWRFLFAILHILTWDHTHTLQIFYKLSSYFWSNGLHSLHWKDRDDYALWRPEANKLLMKQMIPQE